MPRSAVGKPSLIFISRSGKHKLEDKDAVLWMTVTSDLPVEAEVELKGESPLRVQTVLKKNTPSLTYKSIKITSNSTQPHSEERNIDIIFFLRVLVTTSQPTSLLVSSFIKTLWKQQENMTLQRIKVLTQRLQPDYE